MLIHFLVYACTSKHTHTCIHIHTHTHTYINVHIHTISIHVILEYKSNNSIKHDASKNDMTVTSWKHQQSVSNELVML